jgi:purine nucleosidase
MAAGAGGDGYLGAWSGPEPKTDADLKPSPDGFATHTTLQRKSAVDFIVDTVKANPNEIAILAIGPLTNIALAVKQNPEIVPLIKKIIYMGGAVDVAGNTTKAAEFNWWFDPDAAQFVVRLPIPQVVVPLDVTDTVFLTKTIYDRIAHPAKPTAVTDVFQKLNGYGFDGKNGFENNPNYTQNIWDTLTLAYLIDPTYATQTVERYVDVVAKPGAADNGRSIGYASQPAGPTLAEDDGGEEVRQRALLRAVCRPADAAGARHAAGHELNPGESGALAWARRPSRPAAPRCHKPRASWCRCR